AQALLTTIYSLGSDEIVAICADQIDASEFDAIRDSTQILLDRGSIRWGIDPPHKFDPALATRVRAVRDPLLAGVAAAKDAILQEIADYTQARIREANRGRYLSIGLGLLCIGVCIGSGFFIASRLSRAIGGVATSLRGKANEGL